MKVHMSRRYATDQQELRRRLQHVEGRLQEKYRARTSWVDEATMTIGAPGVRGQLKYDAEEVHVDLDVSAVLRPLRGRIEKELGKELDRVVDA